MIFVTIGSQKFQFNRLLLELDKLVEEKKITEPIYAQIGYSTYTPQNYKYKRFLDRNEFSKIMDECDYVITHGGTGAIVGAVKKGKKVIAIPRLAKYEEHVDNHQIEITNQFKEMNLIESVNNVKLLYNSILKIKKLEFNKYKSNTNEIIESIEKFIIEGK